MPLEAIIQPSSSTNFYTLSTGSGKEDSSNIVATYALLAQVKNALGSITEPNEDLFDALAKYANNPDKIPALNYAVKMRDEKAVTVLLNNGMDINKPSSLGTPLQIAFKQNDLSMARLLIQKQAKLDGIMFDLAISNLSDEGVQLLINSGFKPDMINSSTLVKAVQNKSIKSLQMIMSVGQGVPVSYQAIQDAVINGFNEGLEILLNSGFDITPYIYSIIPTAINSNNEKAITLLINAGIKLKNLSNGGEVLFKAIKNPKVSSRLIELLIGNGIACEYSETKQTLPNLKSPGNIAIVNEEYPIITAAVERGDFSIVSGLIDRGVKCDIPFSPTISFMTDDKLGPLHDPVLNPPDRYGTKRPTQMQVTLTNGNLNYNPLYKAVMANRADIAELLLRHGAKPIFTTNRTLGVTIEAKDVNVWHDLLYFQEYITIEQPPFRGRPQPPQKILQPKSCAKGLEDLTKKLDALISEKKAYETTKNGILLMTAIQNQNPQMVRLLLDAGHRVNYLCDNGKMPIKMAVENGNREIITLLLNHGAEWDGV